MLKIAQLLVATLFLGTFVFAQSKTFDTIAAQIKQTGNKNLQIEYEKASNYSKVYLLSGELADAELRKNGLQSLTFGVMFGFTGKELTFTPDVFVLTFWARTKNHKFADSHSWTVRIDTEDLDLGEARYANMAGDPREFLNFMVTRENMSKIAVGKDEIFKLGNVEFKPSAQQIKAVADFINVLDVSR